MKLYMQVLIALGLGLKRNWHIFAGLVLGVLAGIWLHKDPNPVVLSAFHFIGQMFIRLIQMVVIPLGISAIVIGITSVSDSKQIGKLGSKMILYYAIITSAAVSIGAFLALVFKPGLGAASFINSEVATSIQAQVATTIETQMSPIPEFTQADAAPVMATPEVPILLAASPLEATRSQPTKTACIQPCFITAEAMLSQMRVVSTPSAASSKAESRAPCSRGRVSSANTLKP